MSDRHPIDDFFRAQLESEELPPPMHIWERIAETRDRAAAAPASTRRPGWSFLVLLSGMLALITVCIPLILNDTKPAISHFPITVTPTQKPVDHPRALNARASEYTPTPAARQAGIKRLSSVAALPTSTPVLASPQRPLEAIPKRPDAQPVYSAIGLHYLDNQKAVAPVSQQKDIVCSTFNPREWDTYLELSFSRDFIAKRMTARDPEFADYVDQREGTEQPGFAYSLALRLSAVSATGFAIKGGLNYSEIRERFEFEGQVDERRDVIYSYDEDDNLIGVDTVLTPIIQTVVGRNRYQTVDVPILVGYELQRERMVLALNGGAIVNMVFNQQGTMVSPIDGRPVDFNSGNPNGFMPFKNRLGIGFYGSVGMHYRFSTDWQLVVEPYLKTYPQSFSSDANVVDQNYLTSGIFFGLRKRV